MQPRGGKATPSRGRGETLLKFTQIPKTRECKPFLTLPQNHLIQYS